MTNLVALFVGTLAAVTDYRTGKIPNWLTLPALAFALGWAALEGSSASILLTCAASLTTAFIPLGFYLMTQGQALGGGDVKLLLALGALVGPSLGLQTLVLGLTLAAISALIQRLGAAAPPEMRLGPPLAVSLWLSLLPTLIHHLPS